MINRRNVVLIYLLMLSSCSSSTDVDHGTGIRRDLEGDWCHLSGSGYGDPMFRLNQHFVQVVMENALVDTFPITEVTTFYEHGTNNPKKLYIKGTGGLNGGGISLWLLLEHPQRDNLPVVATVSGINEDSGKYVRVPRNFCSSDFWLQWSDSASPTN